MSNKLACENDQVPNFVDALDKMQDYRDNRGKKKNFCQAS